MGTQRHSLEEPTLSQPEEITLLIEMMKHLESFDGGNTELAEKFNSFSGKNISAKALKQLMNRWRYQLEEKYVYFKSSRSNGQRFLEIRYIPPSARDESAVQDGTSTVCDLCVPSVPCVPAESEETA